MRISVIVPCYNTARYLGEALESVLVQRPQPTEVIVVDDGSTDGSHKIAERYRPFVTCVRQAHEGISVARNRGLTEAKGDVIAYLDADDIWTADSVSRRAHLLQSDPLVDSAGGFVEQFLSPELPEAVRERLVCPDGLSSARVAGTLLIRRPVFDRIGAFNASYHVGETIDWVARADAAGVVMRAVDAVVLRRRIHDANTGGRSAPQRSDYLRVLKASLDRRRTIRPPLPPE